MKSPTIFALGIVAALAVASVRADVIVTYAESPGAENSSLANTSVLTFDSLQTGKQLDNVTWTDPTNGVVGTFDKLYIKPADQYGGAADTAYPNGSPYSVQGEGLSVTQTVLTLNTPSAYFGLWWSAGDSANVLTFLSGTNVMARFTTANLMSKLPKPAYYGNPNPGTLHGKDSNEPFAFINFYADKGTTWDSVVFSNSTSSGFESDNYTDRTGAWGTGPGESGTPPPGVAIETIYGTTEQLTSVPEPSQPMAIAAMIGVFGLCVARPVVRRRK